jgi:hypothetical protein
MSSNAFSFFSSTGSLRSLPARLLIATANNASNLVNNTITGTGQVVTELNIVNVSENAVTISCVTFIKKHFFGTLDCPLQFIHWDAVPIQCNYQLMTFQPAHFVLKLLPNGMNPFLEKPRLRTICDELLQSFEFVCRTSFEASRVMKDEFVIAPENQFILDVVHSALACISKDSRRVRIQYVGLYVMILTPVDPSTWVRLI